MTSAPQRTVPEPPGLSASQLHLLATLCGELGDSPGLPTLVARLAHGLSPLVPFDQVALAMKAPDGRLWGLVRPRLTTGSEPAWIELADPESPLEEALNQDQPVLRSAAGKHVLPPGLEAATPIRELSLFPAAACLPIRGPDGPLGALGLFSAAGAPYAVTHLHVLAIIAPVVETTARKLVLLEEAARAESDLRRADGLRSEILDQLRSELRSPLTVLDNGLDFLQSALIAPGAAEAREQVDELRLVAGTMVDMVEDILELSQIDAATLEIQSRLVRLPTLLQERLQLRATAARLGEVQLLMRCDPPEVQVNVDARLLGRVVDNLVLNALRHTPRRGQIAVVAIARHQTLTLAVADTGTPIAATERDLIFERGPWPGDERRPSRAFGLAYCRSAIDYLGGRLIVEAPPGAGNLFRVTLPQ